jgi:hypothetical protein
MPSIFFNGERSFLLFPLISRVRADNVLYLSGKTSGDETESREKVK